MALGLPLPKKVFGHPWLLSSGDKMSKSKGNVLYADNLADVFGVDAVRYYVLSSMPFDNDGLVSWQLMADKINSDLANVYGNLLKRTVAMCNKYFGGVVEKSGVCFDESIDGELISLAKGACGKVTELMEQCRISDALGEIFTLLRRANKYIDQTEPWVLAKNEADAPKLKTVLYNLVETIAVASTLLAPFMPETSEKALAQLNAPERSFDSLSEFGLYPSGNKVEENPETLFARIDADKINEIAAFYAQKYAVPAEKNENESPEKNEKTDEISIEDFAKISLKTALVTACERVEKSKKLLKLTLKIGDEERVVASGIAQYYSPEELVGKKVVVVYNLKAAKLCGVQSQGMVLCAEKDGKVTLIEPNDAMPDGSVVR